MPLYGVNLGLPWISAIRNKMNSAGLCRGAKQLTIHKAHALWDASFVSVTGPYIDYSSELSEVIQLFAKINIRMSSH